LFQISLLRCLESDDLVPAGKVGNPVKSSGVFSLFEQSTSAAAAASCFGASFFSS